MADKTKSELLPEAERPTHDLLLSDGRTVEHYGAIPTHYHDGDKVLTVLAATER